MGDIFDDLFDGPPEDDDSADRGEGEYENCVVTQASPKAILVKFPNRSQPHWVPKSQLTGGDCCEKGDSGFLRVTDWLVEKWEEEGFNPDKEAEEDPEDSHAVLNTVCMRETDSALMVRVKEKDIWFPKTHIKKDSEVQGDGDVGTLVISGWIAKQKNLGASAVLGSPSGSTDEEDKIPF